MTRRASATVRTSIAVGAGALASWLARRALRTVARSTTASASVADATGVPGGDDEPRREVDAAVRRAAVELHRRATIEALAGLTDRAVLERELDRRDRPTSVVMADLNGFGLDDGDARHVPDEAVAEVLRQVGERLRSIVRSDTAVHHLGGDEFVVVVDGDRYVADAIARRVTEAFSSPFSVRGNDIVLSINMGISEVAADDDPSDAVHRADLARFRAARSGGGVAIAPGGPRGRDSRSI